jgi:hypothetical protein
MGFLNKYLSKLVRFQDYYGVMPQYNPESKKPTNQPLDTNKGVNLAPVFC